MLSSPLAGHADIWHRILQKIEVQQYLRVSGLGSGVRMAAHRQLTYLDTNLHRI